jgi:hypothetical protein
MSRHGSEDPEATIRSWFQRVPILDPRQDLSIIRSRNEGEIASDLFEYGSASAERLFVVKIWKPDVEY